MFDGGVLINVLGQLQVWVLTFDRYLMEQMIIYEKWTCVN